MMGTEMLQCALRVAYQVFYHRGYTHRLIPFPVFPCLPKDDNTSAFWSFPVDCFPYIWQRQRQRERDKRILENETRLIYMADSLKNTDRKGHAALGIGKKHHGVVEKHYQKGVYKVVAN